jgi:hypothetical protein
MYNWLNFFEGEATMREVCSKVDETWVPVSFIEWETIELFNRIAHSGDKFGLTEAAYETGFNSALA